MAQISAEHEAAQRGLAGIAEGTVKHRFLHAHMDRVWALRGELASKIGNEDQATAMVCKVMLSE